ncbi:helix-turn-helix transcriptional regulator [Priestia megaterium]|uniref:helix-turn-helix domain-containing protein n=1 Tax=Priestia megaterium TaxID=1404 RepID=UPI002E1AA78F|nr:helix-turn-helix transcriptional regulator [Priestia megaterium]
MQEELKVLLGKRIRELRIIKGISQEELASIADIHRTYIGAIERGEKNITVCTASKVAQSLNITLEELVKGL